MGKRFDAKVQAAVDKIVKAKIQAGLEGSPARMELESLYTMTRGSDAIPGIKNNYKTYESQIEAVYKKYNNEDDFGNAQTRAVIDIRSAFIAGEGLSINIDKKDIEYKKLFDDFLNANRLMGSNYFRIVKGTEFNGKALCHLIDGTKRTLVNDKDIPLPQIKYYPYRLYKYRIDVDNFLDMYNVRNVSYKKKGQVEEQLLKGRLIYIRTGGDDCELNKTTTKIGCVLNELENYDRAMKDIRANNHYFGKVTLWFETKTKQEAKELLAEIKKKNWRMGQIGAGTGVPHLITPEPNSFDNFKIELSTDLKAVAATTSVPVHWLSWVDLMSNRATAETLYDLINTGTIMERTIIAEAFRELFILMQEMYIDKGGSRIKTILRDFDVTIPILDFSRFLDLIRGLNIALMDEVITKKEYRSYIPGLSPFFEDEEKMEEENGREQKYKEALKNEQEQFEAGQERKNGND
jgi:hypothetical protein